jgi:hypothetical protein
MDKWRKDIVATTRVASHTIVISRCRGAEPVNKGGQQCLTKAQN